MDVEHAAAFLAKEVLEAKNPKDFLKKLPRKPGFRYKIPYAHSWDDRGLCNSDYFQGAGTAFTDWDDAIVGAGDNPAEACADAAEQAWSMWNLEGYDIEDDAFDQETPSASDEIQTQVEDEARSELDEDDFDSKEDFEAAVAEKAEEMMEMGDFNLYYYVVLYLREYKPELDAEE